MEGAGQHTDRWICGLHDWRARWVTVFSSSLHLLTPEAIYSLNFPWMDQSEHMSKNPLATMGRAGVLGLFQLRDPSTARKAVDIVSIFRGKLTMADGWFRSL